MATWQVCHVDPGNNFYTYRTSFHLPPARLAPTVARFRLLRGGANQLSRAVFFITKALKPFVKLFNSLFCLDNEVDHSSPLALALSRGFVLW